MAKTRNLEISSTYKPDAGSIRGPVVVLNGNDETDFEAAKAEGLSPLGVRTRGLRDQGEGTTELVVGRVANMDTGLVLPFDTRAEGQAVAAKINRTAESIRRRLG